MKCAISSVCSMLSRMETDRRMERATSPQRSPAVMVRPTCQGFTVICYAQCCLCRIHSNARRQIHFWVITSVSTPQTDYWDYGLRGIHGIQRINPHDFGDLLAFSLRPSSGIHIIIMILSLRTILWIPRMHPSNSC